MDPWIGYKVGLELCQVNIECSIKPGRARKTFNVTALGVYNIMVLLGDVGIVFYNMLLSGDVGNTKLSDV